MVRALVASAVVAMVFLAGCSDPPGAGPASNTDDGPSLPGQTSGGEMRGGDSSGGGAADGSGASGSGGGSKMSAWSLELGSTWTTRMTGTGIQGTTRSTVEGRETRNGFDSWVVRASATMTSGGSTFESATKSWMRVSDLAAVAQETSTAGGAGAAAAGQRSTTVFDPPCQSLRFPFGVGDEWTASCTATTSHGDSGTQGTPVTTTTTYAVEAVERVQVPAGTFEAFRLAVQVAGSGTRTTQWMSAAGCGMVKAESSSTGSTVVIELLDAEC